MLDIKDAAPPNDTSALLALLLELSVANRLPAGAIDRIGQLKLTGKAKAAQKELLARSQAGVLSGQPSAPSKSHR